jgi:hypothetical protein
VHLEQELVQVFHLFDIINDKDKIFSRLFKFGLIRLGLNVFKDGVESG